MVMNMNGLGVGAAVACAMVAGSAQAAGNLVKNGDFSEGNAGFSSQYQYATPSTNALYGEGVYTVAGNPHDVHQYWVDLDSSNNRLIVNGAATSSPVIWQEDNLSTVQGQTYLFSASAANLCCNASFPAGARNDPSDLLFEMSEDGFQTFTTLTGLMTHPPDDAGRFGTASATFTAQGATSFRIVDKLSGQSGNDFAIDDISVTAVSAAPEPGVWMLMIAGIGMIGAMLGYRKRVLIDTQARMTSIQ